MGISLWIVIDLFHRKERTGRNDAGNFESG